MQANGFRRRKKPASLLFGHHPFLLDISPSVLATEALYDRPQETLREAFSFLGLPYHAPEEFKTLNAAAPHPDMDPRTRQELCEYFEPHNRRLYEFLDKDLGW